MKNKTESVKENFLTKETIVRVSQRNTYIYGVAEACSEAPSQ